MKLKSSLFVALALLVVGCETMPTVNSDGDVPGVSDTPQIPSAEVEGIVITFPAWEETRAYSRLDLTVPELTVGEAVAVVDERGVVHKFYVVEKIDGAVVDTEDDGSGGDDVPSEDSENAEGAEYVKDKEGEESDDNSDNNSGKSFLIESPDVELVLGENYRVQYPYPEVWNTEPFWMSLGFGGYESTPTLDWFVSKWYKYTKEGKLHFNLKRINSVLIFNVVAPFSGQIEEVRLGSENVMFCVKGAFDCSQDDLQPSVATWVNQYKFPHKNMTWVEGETYELIVTLMPYDYSTEEYTLDIYTVDDGVAATTPISIPKLKEGEIVEYQLSEFEILPAPVYEKDVYEEEREGFETINGPWVHPGELY